MDTKYTIYNSELIPSPSLIFYTDTIRQNIDMAISIAKNPLRLRPHVKSHKTKEIVLLQMEAGIQKFKCATIAEAEMVAQCKAKDVLIAYPLVGPNIRRFTKLILNYPQTNFKATVDNKESAHELSEAAILQNITVETLIDVDSGLHRTGVDPGDAAVELYKTVASLKGLLPGGIHCYDGQNHQPEPEVRAKAAKECYETIRELQRKLASLGLPANTLVLGGTPTFPMYARFPEVELSPGTCFLHDWGYSSSFKDMDFSYAALVLSRVISLNQRESTFTLDLGSKAIASDPAGVRGIILNMEHTEPLFQNEEHWVFKKTEGALPLLGQEAFILPTHICPTSALYDAAFIIDKEGNWSSKWEIIARNRQLSI